MKGVAKKRLRPFGILSYTLGNRHLAEWRFLLFTRIVTVQNRTWKVNVIGMSTPPFGKCRGTAFFHLGNACPYGRLYSTGFAAKCQFKAFGRRVDGLTRRPVFTCSAPARRRRQRRRRRRRGPGADRGGGGSRRGREPCRAPSPGAAGPPWESPPWRRRHHP